jgi:hypothetical protein
MNINPAGFEKFESRLPLVWVLRCHNTADAVKGTKDTVADERDCIPALRSEMGKLSMKRCPKIIIIGEDMHFAWRQGRTVSLISWLRMTAHTFATTNVSK